MNDGKVWNSNGHISHFRQIVHFVHFGEESTLMLVNSAATTTQVMLVKVHAWCS